MAATYLVIYISGGYQSDFWPGTSVRNFSDQLGTSKTLVPHPIEILLDQKGWNQILTPTQLYNWISFNISVASNNMWKFNKLGSILEKNGI